MRTIFKRVRMRGAGLCAIVAALVIGSAPLAAQGVPNPPRPPRSWHGSGGVAKIDTIVPFSANGSVELSLIAGRIKLSTWDRNQVRVVASSSGIPSLQFDASRSHIELDQMTGDGDNEQERVGSATYDVTVPVGARATLSAVSGNIDASGVHGRLDVSNVSGDVNVRDVGSSLRIEAVSSPITVVDVGGDARVENVSGTVSLSRIAGSVHVETVSGSLVINGVRGDRVHAGTISGGIDFMGAATGSGRYEFESHSGQINLRLASNANATARVETFSGSVTNSYPGAVRNNRADSDEDSTTFEYVFGKGDGRVRVETFSGSVHISQGNQ